MTPKSTRRNTTAVLAGPASCSLKHHRSDAPQAIDYSDGQWLVICAGCVVDVAGCHEDATRSADMIARAHESGHCYPIVEVVRDEQR